MSRYAFQPYYDGSEKYIGLDSTLAEHPRLMYTDGIVRVCDGIVLYPCPKEEKEHELGNFGLTVIRDGGVVSDDFRHEQYMLVEERGRRILISGCSHWGVLDLMRIFRPHVLIGGFHFFKIPLGETLASYADILAGYDTEYYTCHCTGTEQYAFMKERMPRLHYISAGQKVEI